MSSSFLARRKSPLILYLGEDGNIWAANQADGRGYLISSMSYPRSVAAEAAPAATNATTLQAADGSSLELSISDVGGDLIVKALSGPNAGKSVNLTYGKWA